MRVIPLGTSSGTPTRQRNVSAVALVMDRRWILLDCGEGTQHRLLDAPLKVQQLELVLITHLHGDHLFGLPGLLGTLSLQSRGSSLRILGPEGIREYLHTSMRISHSQLSYGLEIQELDSSEFSGDKPVEVLENEYYRVCAAPLVHRIRAYGYRIEARGHPGKFNSELARKLGVEPGPLYRELQLGRDIVLPDGKTVQSSEVVGSPRKGKVVVYCTDTVPCKAAVVLGSGADLLIHEATYAEDLVEQAHERGHSTAKDAAQIARQAGAKRLLLTHFSPRYSSAATLLEEARAEFPESVAGRDLEPIDL